MSGPLLEVIEDARVVLAGAEPSADAAMGFARALVQVADACVVGLPCDRHGGAVHGREAEELRRGIERILRNFDLSECVDPPRVEQAMLRELHRLLDEVDARDSVAFLEKRDGDEIDDSTPSWWHGCWLRAGHFLWNRDGAHADDSPLAVLQLDGGYVPRRHRGTYALVALASTLDYEKRRELGYKSDELPQGQYLRSIVKLDGTIYTILAWWDRTQGDPRSACNSCFIVRGDHSAAMMLAAFPRHFPKQVERLAAAGVRLVEAR